MKKRPKLSQEEEKKPRKKQNLEMANIIGIIFGIGTSIAAYHQTGNMNMSLLIAACFYSFFWIIGHLLD